MPLRAQEGRPVVVDVAVGGTQFARKGDLFVATSEAALVGGEAPPEAVKAAFAAAFESLGAAVAAGGQTLDEVGRVFVTIPDRGFRAFVNEPWLDLFPGDNRPARRTTTAPVGPAGVVQLRAVGVAGAARVPVHLDGLPHKDPLPNGVRIGDYFFSSALTSDAPEGGRPAGTAGIDQSWRNFEAFVEAAGAALDDVVNVWVFLGAWDLRTEVDTGWLRLFPAENRPSRKTFQYPETPIQLLCDGVVGGGARRNYEDHHLAHSTPIPLAASRGAVFATSGISAVDPATRAVPDTPYEQVRQALANLRGVLAGTQFGFDSVLEIVGLARDEEGAEALAALRADLVALGAAPVVQALRLGLAGHRQSVQLLARCSEPAAVNWRAAPAELDNHNL
jgi:enamine deaminase RidA (YjgF/YER057c/UK114 family)